MSHASRLFGWSRCRRVTIALASTMSLAIVWSVAGPPAPAGLPGAAPRPALAQGERFGLSVVGQIGGGSAGFVLAGDYLYLGIGPRIAVYDVRRPDAPVRIAQTAPFAEVVKGLAVEGSRLYAIGWGGYLDETAYLAVLDVADPARPRLLGRRGIDDMSPIGAIAAHARRVYVLDSGASKGMLHVLDATDPADIRFVHRLPVKRVIEEDRLRVVGDRLWWVSGAEGLVAFDLADPAAPRELGRFKPGGASLLDAAIVGDLAYATDAENNLTVIDVRDPAAMTRVYDQSVPEEAVAVTVSDGRLYVAHLAGVTAFTLANPRRPEPLGTLDLPDVMGIGFYAVAKLAAARGHAFLLTDDGSLRVVDYADPADPAVVAQAQVLPIVEDVAVDGDVAYVATTWSGLWTLDVSNPADPRLLGAVDVDIDELNPATLSSLTAAGGFAYAFDAWSATLFVVDATDPAALSVVGRLDGVPSRDDRSPNYSIAYADDTVWIPFANVLSAVDVGDPTAPRLLGSVDILGANSVAVAGSTVFVGGVGAEIESVVYAVDAADPGAPTVIARYAVPQGHDAPALGLDGHYLYAAGKALTVLDVSVPGAPVQVQRYAANDETWFSDVALGAGFAFLLGDRVTLLDTRTAGQLSFAAGAAVAGPDYVAGGRISARGEFAFLAAGEAGLYVLRRAAIGDPGQPGLPEVTGQIGGGTAAVVAADDIAYVARGPRVAIYRRSDRPGTPSELLATTEAFDEVVRALAVDGDRLYAITGGPDDRRYGLVALDVAEPREPRLLGRSHVGYELTALAARGEHVYAAGPEGLRVVDMSDPALPRIGTSFDTLPNADARLLVTGDHLYAVAGELRVYDLSDPVQPELAGAWAPDDDGLVTDVTVVGQRAYALDDLGNLHVLDVAAPDAIQSLGGIAIGEDASRIAATEGGGLFVVYAGGLAMIGLDDPDHPALIRVHPLPGLWLEPQTDLALAGGTVLVAGTHFGVHVVDAENPALARDLEPLRGVPPAKGAALAGDIAYVAGGIGGLWTVEAKGGARPRALGHVDLGDAAVDPEPADLVCVTVAGDHAYALSARWNGLLHVIDVRDPASPREVGVVELPSDQGVTPDVANIAYADGHVYLPFGQRLWVVDVREPTAPRIAGMTEVKGAHSVAVRDGIAYVGGDDYPSLRATLSIVDARDPGQPKLVETLRDLGGSSAPVLALDGGRLHVAHGPLGIFDLTEPLQPRRVFQSGPGERGFLGIAAADGFAFLAENFAENGVAAYDVREPARARRLGAARLAGSLFAQGTRLAAEGRRALSARDEAGLYLLDRGEAGPGPGEGPRGGTLYLPWAQRGR